MSQLSQPQPVLRLRRANRQQIVAVPARLEEWLAPDHLARLIWQTLQNFDLSAFGRELKVVEGGQGRAATDPAILVALWLYALTQGVHSARLLDRLCVEHRAYIWLCGGVSMNYHTLADFRVNHQAALSALMSELLACLAEAELIGFEHCAQDGLRVRASAGAASFRGEANLSEKLAKARQVVDQWEAKTKQDEERAEGESNARKHSAQVRAAQEKLARLEAALEQLPAVRAAKPPKERAKARVSTTDSEARIMKMADGGYRPAYNFQFGVDSKRWVIVGVSVNNNGSDKGQAEAMVEQVEERTKRLPKQWLMDGGFVKLESTFVIEGKGVQVLAPVPQPRQPERERYAALPSDSKVIGAWRERMGEAEAKEVYKKRAATVELVNAQARMRYGLQQLRVRGLAKAETVALWIGVTHNLLVWLGYLGRSEVKHGKGQVG